VEKKGVPIKEQVEINSLEKNKFRRPEHELIMQWLKSRLPPVK